MSKITIGVPTFLLYINGMYRSSNQMRFVQFADGTTLVFEPYCDINNVHATVNRELEGVDNWLKASRFFFNFNETSYMIISKRKTYSTTLQFE